jgi:hypothetical protein
MINTYRDYVRRTMIGQMTMSKLYAIPQVFKGTYWWSGVVDSPEYHEACKNRVSFYADFGPLTKSEATTPFGVSENGLLDHMELYRRRDNKDYVVISSPYRKPTPEEGRFIREIGWEVYPSLYNSGTITVYRFGALRDLRTWVRDTAGRNRRAEG